MKKRILMLISVFPALSYGQTQGRNDAGLQGDAGATSGFFETSNPVNYPFGATAWWHLLDVRHSNNANNYAMQFAGSFYDQNLYFRKTINNPATPWSRVLLEENGKVDINTTAVIGNSAGNNYNENLRLPSSSAGYSSIALGAVAGNTGTGPGQWTLIKYPQSQDSKFTIRHNNDDYMNILTNGNVGIGILNPQYKFNIAQDVSMNEDINVAQFGISGSSDNAKRLVLGYDVNGAGFGYIKAGWYQHQWTNLALQPQGGNVGIGTTVPNEKLSVNGKIRAKEIKVEATNWPDYVFDQDYQLLGLQDLDSYIKAHKHLPEMPSSVNVEKNGLELGEMNKLLLKKIEELTLHLIDLDKKVKVLEADNKNLKSKNDD